MPALAAYRSNKLQFIIYFLKKSGTKIIRSCAEKMCEIISARAEMRESHAKCVRPQTWHV